MNSIRLLSSFSYCDGRCIGIDGVNLWNFLYDYWIGRRLIHLKLELYEKILERGLT